MSSEKWSVRSLINDAVRGDQGLVLDSQDANNNKRINVEDISRLQSAAKDYSNLLTYKLGDFVLFGGTFFRNILAITSGETFDPAKWIEVVPHVLRDYSASSTYILDELVDFNGTFYKNITPITIPEVFDSAKWVEVGGTNSVVNVRNVLDFPDAKLASFASVEDNGGGFAQFVFSGAHGYTDKQTVLIENSTVASYNGFHVITVISTTKFFVDSLAVGVTATGEKAVDGFDW